MCILLQFVPSTGLTYEVNAQDRVLLSVNGQYRNDNYDGPVDRTDHRIPFGGAFTINFAEYVAFETALIGDDWRLQMVLLGLSMTMLG